MASSVEDKKIFDNYGVHCEECQHYWNDACDGTREGVYKPCTAFVATKRIDLPSKVENLQKRLVRAQNSIWILYIIVILHLLSHIIF